MDDLHIRIATSDDVAILERLFQLFYAELLGERGGTLWSRSEARNLNDAAVTLLADLEASDRRIWLVEFEQVPAGYICVSLTALQDDGQIAVIREFFVEAAFRGLGLGEALMHAATEWASDQRAVAIEATVLPGARIAKNFFESNGLKARALRVSKDL